MPQSPNCGRQFRRRSWQLCHGFAKLAASPTEEKKPMAITLANRQLRLATPLGQDKLLPVEFAGTEALSRLFEFRLTMLAENATKVEFDKLIGQRIVLEIDMPGHKTRYFHGICNRFAEGRRDNPF